MATVRHLGDGRYLARHTAPNGQRKTRRLRGDKPRGLAIPRAVQREADRWGVEVDRETNNASRSLSNASIGFAEFSVEYVERNRHRWTTKASRANKCELVEEYVKHFGTAPLDGIGEHEVAAYHAQLLKRGCSPVTANTRTKSLRTVLRDAVGRYRVIDPRSYRIEYATEYRKEGRVNALSTEQEQTLRDVMREHAPDLLPAVVTMLTTGMRPGECLAMRWDWIDQVNAVIRIPGRDDHGFQTKTKRGRDIPLPSGLMAWLESQPAISGFVHPVRDPRGKGGIGSRYDRWPRGRYKRLTKLAGVAWSHGYTLRHTFASHFLTRYPAEGALYELSRLLGHASVTMTEKYIHFLPERFKVARSVMVAPAYR